jgi:hypothetical protein
MKEAARICILRLLALVEAAALVYPAVLVLRAVLFGEDGGTVSVLLYVLLLALGFLAGRLIFGDKLTIIVRISELRFIKLILFILNVKDKKHFLATAGSIATFIIPVLAVLASYSGKDIFRMVFESAAALVPYFMALRNSNRNYTEIMGMKRLSSGLAIQVAAIEAASLMKFAAHLKPYLMACAYFCILLFLILKNQQEIDTNIYLRKNISKTILPKNMRSFNLKAVIAMFLIIMLLFNLKAFVLLIMDAAGRLAGFIALGILLVLRNIGELFANASGEGLQQMNPDLQQAGIETVHPILNFLGSIVLRFVLMYLAYRIILILAGKLPILMKKISCLLKRLFSMSDTKTAVVEEYRDEVETIRPDFVRENGKADRRRIRNNARNLKTITDPVERIRYIYGSLLVMLSSSGVKP